MYFGNYSKRGFTGTVDPLHISAVGSEYTGPISRARAYCYLNATVLSIKWYRVMKLNSSSVLVLLALFAAASLVVTLLCGDASRFMHRLRKNTVALAGWVLILLVESIARHLR
jgi:hypothetical protein